jgi:signal transduction histidine kinase
LVSQTSKPLAVFGARIYKSDLAISIFALATMVLALFLLLGNEQAKFDSRAEQRIVRISEDIRVDFSFLEAQLFGIAATAQDARDDFIGSFHSLIAATTSHPATPSWTGIAYAPEVERYELQELRKWIISRNVDFRALHYPDFRVFPRPAESIDRSILPVLLVVPPSSRGRIFGFDFASEETRLEAYRRASDGHHLGVTPLIPTPGLKHGDNLRILAVATTHSFDWLNNDSVDGTRRGAILGSLDLKTFLTEALGDTRELVYSLKVRHTPSVSELSICRPSCNKAAGADLFNYQTKPSISKIILGDLELLIAYSETAQYSVALYVTIIASLFAIASSSFSFSYFLAVRRKQLVGRGLDLEREIDLDLQRKLISTTAVMNAHFYNAVNGILHDLNNTLGIGSGHLEAARRDVGIPADAMGHLAKVEGALALAGDLGKRLDLFEPARQSAKKEISIHDILSEIAMAVELITDVDIVTELSEGTKNCKVCVAPLELRLAIMNLVFNGLNAIENGDGPGAGRLTISSRIESDPIPEYLFGLPTTKDKMFVQISVTDDGIGMDKATLNKLDEPGYTSKSGASEGHGFGISSVRDFARDNGGVPYFFSNLGEGTTSTLVLPLHW